MLCLLLLTYVRRLSLTATCYLLQRYIVRKINAIAVSLKTGRTICVGAASQSIHPVGKQKTEHESNDCYTLFVFETYARPCFFLAVSHPIDCKFTTFRWKHKWLDTNTEHICRLPEMITCT